MIKTAMDGSIKTTNLRAIAQAMDKLSTRTCSVKLINYWSFSSPSLSLVPQP